MNNENTAIQPIEIVPGYTINIEVEDDIYLPFKAHVSDAAYDVRACVDKPVVILPGNTALIPLGFKLALPSMLEAIITPRSGLAAKNGITVLNSPGTVDSGYRGDVMVVLHNTGMEEFVVYDRDRIAQMKIKEVLITNFNVVPRVDNNTERGSTGFGNSGIK